MKVLHINSTSHTGGAARAMQRLHDSLIDKKQESQFLVGRSRFPNNPEINIIWDVTTPFRSVQNSVLSRIGNQFEKYLGINSWANRPAINLAGADIYQWADIIDLRNLFGGFFNLWSLPDLTRKKPVVWRLPDMWALTGHCAYPYDCDRWKNGCYQCPLLRKVGRERVEPKPTILDGTRRVWNAKRDIYNQSQLHIVVNSTWMKKQVEESILGESLSLNVISNGVNLEIYRPIDQILARKSLGLPLEGKILLWAASEKDNFRKGFHIAFEAIDKLQKIYSETPILITMGGSENKNISKKVQNQVDFGFVRDPEQQALIYSAADVFLCTTLADAQPQTALESLACGTPIITFAIGPMPEIVHEGKEGFIATDLTSQALSVAIIDFYNRRESFPELRENCRKKAERLYNLDKQTDRYIDLYEQILS
jgi:glycosyltransferase involved in cell wall biosynthesis